MNQWLHWNPLDPLENVLGSIMTQWLQKQWASLRFIFNTEGKEHDESAIVGKWTEKFQATVFNNILFEQRLSCSSWNTAMLQSTSASSWDAGYWCGRTSSCGSWRHVGADGRNTWERPSLHYQQHWTIINTWPEWESIARR